MNTTMRFIGSIMLGSSLLALQAERSYALDGAAAACCSCQIAPARTLSESPLPCSFDIPESWEAMVGDDGAVVSAVAGAQCETVCPVSSGVTFGVARKPNANAETMEETWTQVMEVVGHARCGDRSVTFFSPPGSDPAGLMGGLRFHVEHGGEVYGANATFTCPGPGQWLQLRQLFIDTFKTNQSITFSAR